jgi:glutamate--cysteine ligase
MKNKENVREKLHNIFLEKSDEIEKWFDERIKSADYPFYCSFDIRESNNKMAPVDANMFPAGFNNICQADRDVMGVLLDRCMNFKKLNFKRIGIFCENHTNNPYYWDNVNALKELFTSRDFEVYLFTPDKEPQKREIESASGHKLKIQTPLIKDNILYVEDFKIDFLLINNDMSSDFESWISTVKNPMLPPLYMGWNKREKQSFFDQYNKVVNEFCEFLGVDSIHLTLETKTFEGFKIDDKESLQKLKETADHMNNKLVELYKEKNFEDHPYLFVKNSHGTYGLGVMEVEKPEDILSWNYKSRKKMKAAKGGNSIEGVIVQEGIPTSLLAQGSPAEAVIYLLGCGLAGGFLRTNQRKDSHDSLNAPGAIFQRLCFSDYEFQKEDRSLENVYGTIARLGALALSLEMKEAAKRA